MKKILLATAFSLISSTLFSQEIIADDVKTVQLKMPDADFGYPVCPLGKSLQLEFDVLDDEYSNLCYTIKHCDCNFNPDDLSFGEFAEGFDNRTIDSYENSFDTHQSFTHYTVTIPNNDIQLTISGNYIINIFDEDNPEDVILSKRFMICENADNSKIKAEIIHSFISEYSFSYQQVKVIFNNDKLQISNPDKYLKVFVMQNNDYTTRKQLQISGFLNNEIQYQKNDGNNLFLGGSEYYHFDAKDVNFKAFRIDDIEFRNGLYNYTLTPTDPVNVSYTYYEDLNGRYYIKNDRGFNNKLEADYVDVLFQLKYDPFVEGKIYVTGELSNFLYNDSNELKFNSQTNLWEKKLRLKQGLYNFQYVIKNNSGNTTEYPSGSWYNTENDYFIAIYTSLLQNRGDRLVMYKVINSVK